MKEIDFLKKNNFSEAVELLEKYENKDNDLRNLIIQSSDEYRLILLALLLDIAYRKNISFWFENIAYFYSFNFDFLDGAQKTSLFYFKKAHKLDVNSERILGAILDFQLPPEKILSLEEATVFANKLLEINPSNERALKIIKDDNNG
tara:strand:- start:90 stop:530 length:441 start_codon:yes stop_codon:yes gene_type:complete